MAYPFGSRGLSASRREDSCAFLSMPGVAEALAEIKADAERRIAPGVGSVRSALALYISHLREHRAGSAALLGELATDDAADGEADQPLTSADEWDALCSREMAAAGSGGALPPPTSEAKPMWGSVVRNLFTGTALVAALGGVVYVDTNIWGTALALRIPDVVGTQAAVSHGSIMGTLLIVGTAGYVAQREQPNRKSRFMASTTRLALPAVVVLGGIFVGFSIISGLGLDRDAAVAMSGDAYSEASGGSLGFLGDLALAAALAGSACLSFVAAHGILVRLRTLIGDVTGDIGPLLLRRARERRVQLQARIDLIDRQIAEASELVAAMISAQVQPAVAAARSAYRKLALRAAGNDSTELRLIAVEVDAFETGCAPAHLLSYMRAMENPPKRGKRKEARS